MTCIVGVIEKGKVFIGADSAGVSGLDISIRKDPKVFKVGEFVIGCTSSFRMIQLLRFSFNPPKRHDEDVYQYMCTGFVNALRQCFKDGGFMEVNSSVESGGCFLVGYQGRLFLIYDDFQVAENDCEFGSIGCGADFAKGALKALGNKTAAKDRITKALEIATYFSGGVRPPFVVEAA
jgi:ATP-dependent protease HslVU (ClpYQ) peptidase subunit